MNETVPSEVLRALEGANGKSELRDKFIGLATSYFENAVAPEDLQRIELLLSEQLGEDPYLKEKLERISSLLAKTK